MPPHDGVGLHDYQRRAPISPYSRQADPKQPITRLEVPVLGGALWVHSGNGWVFSANGGGWEYPLFLIVVSVVVALQAFAVRASSARRAPAALGSIAHQA